MARHLSSHSHTHSHRNSQGKSGATQAAHRHGQDAGKQQAQEYHSYGAATGGGASAGDAGSLYTKQQLEVLNNYRLRRQGSPLEDGDGGVGGGEGSGRSTPQAVARGDSKDKCGEAVKAGVGLFFVLNDFCGLEVDEIIQGSAAHADGRIMVGMGWRLAVRDEELLWGSGTCDIRGWG